MGISGAVKIEDISPELRDKISERAIEKADAELVFATNREERIDAYIGAYIDAHVDAYVDAAKEFRAEIDREMFKVAFLETYIDEQTSR